MSSIALSQHHQSDNTTNLASSQSWNACRRATWSLHRVPARLLWTESRRRRSIDVTNGSENVVLEAIVHTASPQLYHTHRHRHSETLHQQHSHHTSESCSCMRGLKIQDS